MSEPYDLVVIGAGPAGYVAAIRAAQLGFSVACIEKRASLGGTCLNIGCIPSKALLQSSEKYEEARKSFALHGVIAGNVTLDLATMQARKDKVVGELTRGVEFLFKKNKVTWIKGTARLKSATGIVVDGKTDIAAKRILIATGSEPSALGGIAIDETTIVSSTGALALSKVPERLAVIGAGYIGLELGSVWSRLGAKVTVIEFLDRIIPGMDGEIAKQFQRALAKQGLTFKLSTKVSAAKRTKTGAALTLDPANGAGASETLEADVVLVAVGRRPMTEGLGLAEIGVALDERGRIKTDDHFRTSVPGIFAIGDVIAGPMLAHKAEEEGIAAVEQMAGQAGHVNYGTVPGIVYTWPEVATVGKSEEELKAAGIAYKVGKFPFSANARAKTAGDTEGFVKLLADAKTDRLLGAHILGPDAGTLIHECVMAMEFGASAEDVARAFHAHPTLNEAVKEAALGVAGRAIHI